MDMHGWGGLSILGIVLFLSAPAWAEHECSQRGAPAANRSRASEEFEEGQRLYDRADYRGAIEHFQCSYRLAPHHATLFNIGESAERAGDIDLALSAFRQYLERYPEADGRSNVQQRVGNLERARSPEVPPEAPDDVPSPEVPVDPSERTVEMRMTVERRVAWITLALGVAIGTGGGVLYGVASGRNDEYLADRESFERGEDIGSDQTELDSRAQSGAGLEAGGWALMCIGLASLAASVVLFLAFDGEEPLVLDESRAFLTPFIGADEATGLSFGGAF